MQSQKRYTFDEKIQHVASWRASGLTRQQYCALHTIKFSTFREWPQDTKTERRANDSGLLPVHISTTSPAEPLSPVVNDPVMLFLPGGIRMSCHATQLTDVFRALKHAQP
ncbi:IS66 family insertion sequence element accessory protein TnpA [Buttiauxella ferragutiae]|uniref:IS66 family insertion sequence element accessory protein TnpA n=1 Tax=Buttiauxella ferragutiae TaxID=82989 RepID=UPI003525F9FA